MRVTRIVTLVDKKLDSCVAEFRHIDDAQKKKKKNKIFEEGWEQWKFEAEFWGRIFIRNCSREKRDRISWVEEIFIKWIYPLILEAVEKERRIGKREIEEK